MEPTIETTKAVEMPTLEQQPVRTTIHTAPRSKTGKLLRLAAEFMPTVTAGEKGWIQETIKNALLFYIETKAKELGHDPEVARPD